MEYFKDKIALVTGAGSGIGRAIALAMGEQRAKLCLVGRNKQNLEKVAAKLSEKAPRVACYRADLTREEDIRQVHQNLLRDFGQVDMLVHSAGTISLGRVECASLQDFDRQYATNVRGPLALTRALVSLLKARQGQVVFVNSTAALTAKANVGQYAATKAALKAFADSLREEVNPEGVRVLSLFLGRTASPMQQDIYKMEGREYRPELLMQPEDVAAVVLHSLSLPRTAEVTEIRMRPMVKSY